MTRLLLEYRCDAGLAAARKLRKLMQQVLASTVAERSLHHGVLLCLSEILANIAQHNQPAIPQITVRFEETDREWELRITEDGQSYDAEQHRTRSLDDIEEESESGRGLALIHAFCHRFDYLAGADGKPNLTVCAWSNARQSNRPRILVVEDEASTRRLLAHFLSESYQVVEAGNGEEALTVLRDSSVDLVLSDISMPAMDGLTLRAEIARESEHELLPFIFLTASEDGDLCDRAGSLGIDDYLVKPVSRENLLNRVERALQRSRQLISRVSQRVNHKISKAYVGSDPEKLPHWTIAVKRRGTGIGGGDLLLSQVLPEGGLLTLIDTMGHDETSKFFAYAYGGYIGGMMRTAHASGMGCHDLLRQLSQTAYEDELLSKTTFTGLSFELGRGGEVTMACAAHPSPLLVGPDSIASIDVEGVLPGLLPDSEYTPVRVLLKPGERIAIYTDGLVESAADNQARERLQRDMLTAIQDTVNLPIDRASRFIMQVFDEIAGTPPRDDTTFILLEPEFYSTEVNHAR